MCQTGDDSSRGDKSRARRVATKRTRTNRNHIKRRICQKDMNIRIESSRVDFLHAQEEAQLQIYRTSL